MNRHAAHGNVAAIMFAALGERDGERGRSLHRILEEQLVEIAHAIKQQMLGMGVLDGEILGHQRRGIARQLEGFRHGGGD